MNKSIAIKRNRRIDILKIPEKAGVYAFVCAKGKKLYIGKAKNLRSRLRSYFQKDFSLNNPQKENLILESKKIQIEVLSSEIEALIKESFLIKKHRPKYNIIFKDDKNYFFVGFTKGQFPKIIITHQTKILDTKYGMLDWIGPFVSGKALKITLKTLRKIFPYCTCIKPHKRPCLNAQIGLCLEHCCLVNLEKLNFQMKFNSHKLEYRKNISAIKKILTGRSKKLLRDLKREMLNEAKSENFEKADAIKNKITALEKVLAHKKILEKDFSGNLEISEQIIIGKEKIDFSQIKRIEAFDISIFQGKNPVGSMVVFNKKDLGNFSPDKSQYRKFKIKNVFGINDPAMIGEIIRRRFTHKEWPLPDLVLIDGGRPQLNEALKNFLKSAINKSTVFMALAKREELVYTVNNKYPVRTDVLAPSVSLLFKAIRDEAHRFAVSFHQKLREKSLYV